MKKITFLLFAMLLAILSHAQLSWVTQANFPGTARFSPVSFSINGKGYMGLGLDASSGCPVDWYEYDPSTNTWTQKNNFPGTGRFSTVSWVINGKGYISTGATTSGLTNQTYEYDPTTDTWTLKAAFTGSARQNAAGFAIGSKGYVGTGYDGSNSKVDFYEYDPSTNSWSAKANFSGSARNTGIGFSVGTKGYIGLGNSTSSTTNYNDLWEYDPSANTWTKKANLPLYAMGASTTFSKTGAAYILGGYYYQTSGITHNPLNTLFKYEPSTDTWTLLGLFPGIPRGYAGGFSISNDLYWGLGSVKNGTSGIIPKDFWKLASGLTLLSQGPTGFEPSDEEKIDFNLYPNPTSNELILDIEDIAETVTVTDINGSMQTLELDRNKKSIDVSGLSSGLYMVEMITNNGRRVNGKFVKQ